MIEVEKGIRIHRIYKMSRIGDQDSRDERMNRIVDRDLGGDADLELFLGQVGFWGVGLKPYPTDIEKDNLGSRVRLHQSVG